ncbi:CPS_collapsed_G0048430.mRNA.1.CDS.1 [Saccharomyces cerevisiae]|nr:CPS_collapsed_G0048430.mRNA.1.CDS.1 [Saccharomyces cerevisiae]
MGSLSLNSKRSVHLRLMITKQVQKEKETAARKEALEEGIIHSDFATFEDEEDDKYIEKSVKNNLLKKGVNPKAKRPSNEK